MGFAIKTENRQRMRTSDMSFIPFHYSLLFCCLSSFFWEFIFTWDVLLPVSDTAKLQAAPREEIIHFVQMALFYETLICIHKYTVSSHLHSLILWTFPSYVLTFNTPCFADCIGPRRQAAGKAFDCAWLDNSDDTCQFKSWISSLCNYLHISITFPLLCPNILLSILFQNNPFIQILPLR
jgi:hypothetical protein